jgi:CBS domain-containing protein
MLRARTTGIPNAHSGGELVGDIAEAEPIAHCATPVTDGSLRFANDAPLAALVTRLATVVHDLRTPLTAILSWTWALRRGLDGARAAHAIDALERNAHRQARLLDDAAETLRTAIAESGNAWGGGPITEAPHPDDPSNDAAARSSPRLRDVMRAGREALAPGDTIRYAAERLQALDVGALPVCDGERLLGVLTHRDVTNHVVAVGRDPHRTAVIETMTPGSVFALEEQAVGDAVALMRRHAVWHIPVVDTDRRLVGMVALVDLLAGDGVTTTADAAIAPRGLERAP